MITPVDLANFETEVVNADKMVLIDFYADWCGPCKALAPTLEAFAEEHKDTVKVVKINVDENISLAEAFNIRSIPMLVTMKDGTPLCGMPGNHPKENIEKLIEVSLQHAQKNDINKNNKPNNQAPKP
jgi:thioredoxin 1